MKCAVNKSDLCLSALLMRHAETFIYMSEPGVFISLCMCVCSSQRTQMFSNCVNEL